MLNSNVVARVNTERRRHTWRTLWMGTTHGRRSGPRRQDAAFSILAHDRLPTKWVIAGIMAVGLSGLDALITLFILANGGSEVNPVMDAVIGTDLITFASLKMGLTSCGMLSLLLYARYRFLNLFQVSKLIWGAALLYVMLLGYEVSIIWQILENSKLN